MNWQKAVYNSWQGAVSNREAKEELGRRMAAARPESIVVITPHGVRVTGMMCISATERAFGELVDIDEVLEIEEPSPER